MKVTDVKGRVMWLTTSQVRRPDAFNVLNYDY